MAQDMTDAGRPKARLNRRNPRGLSGERFDLIVVGGGIYGAMTALEAVRRGLRPLVLERADFASATSSNSLRIIHGGLRYLQSADLPRYILSARERSWFFETFPDDVRPLPILMPLRGDGLRRRSVFRGALALNNLLSWLATPARPGQKSLPPGRTISAARARDIASVIDVAGLEGGALWHDGFIPDAPALVIDVLRWACDKGAAALNYMDVRALVQADGKVAGVRARDVAGGADLEFRADVVINAAGPWADAFGKSCGTPLDDLAGPTLAWNVVLRRTAWSDHALALTPPYLGAQTYFLVPWKGVMLAGTGHAPWNHDPDKLGVPEDLLRKFLADLNAALPGVELGECDVARVFTGLLPARRKGSAELAKQFTIVNHGARQGPRGLFSLSGVKFTEARAVSDRVLRVAFPDRSASRYGEFARPSAFPRRPDYAFDWIPEPADHSWLEPLREVMRHEDVEHLDDLLLRRSNLGDNPQRAITLAPQACQLWGWDAARARQEVDALRESLARDAFSSA